LPPGEHHEVGLLFAKYQLKAAGHEVLYLGPNVPFENLKEVISFYQPDWALSVLTKVRTDINLEDFVGNMLNSLTGIPLLLAGTQVVDHALKDAPGLTVLKNIQDFIQLINSNITPAKA